MGLQLRGEKSEKRGADLPAPREPTLPSSGHISLQKAQTPPSRPSPAFQNLPLYSHLFQEALRERETGRRPSLSFNGETDTASQVRHHLPTGHFQSLRHQQSTEHPQGWLLRANSSFLTEQRTTW